MEIKQVTSSNLNAVGYDKDTKILRVIFKTGIVYDYFNVEEQVYLEMLKASSLGKFFHANIRNNYQYIRR